MKRNLLVLRKKNAIDWDENLHFSGGSGGLQMQPRIALINTDIQQVYAWASQAGAEFFQSPYEPTCKGF